MGVYVWVGMYVCVGWCPVNVNVTILVASMTIWSCFKLYVFTTEI